MRAIIIAAALAAAPAAAMAGEHSVRPSVANFVVGYDRANAEQAIVEQIPKGESVENWTRMLTSQRFTGRGRDPGPRGLLTNIQASLPRACPGARTSAIAAATVSGRPAVRMRADCPLNSQTGKPETFFIVAFAGTNDLYSEQVAFRRVPSAADVEFANEVLGRLVWCRTGATDKACAPRR